VQHSMYITVGVSEAQADKAGSQLQTLQHPCDAMEATSYDMLIGCLTARNSSKTQGVQGLTK
jgi:hypothetical protein